MERTAPPRHPLRSRHPRRPRLPWLPLLAALALGACSGDDETPGSSDVDAAPPGTGEPDAAPEPVRCEGLSAPPAADQTLTLTHAGASRSYNLHVPASYDPTTPTPLVLDFHGLTSNAAQEDFLSRARAKSDAAGFIVVQPQGLQNSWNAGACCGQASQTNVDDVGFVGALLDELEDELCLDARRVYAMGMSNGGFMSHRLACELSDRIAAIASIAGVNAFQGCAPARPVPVLQIHGTGDSIVAYAGSNGGAGVVDMVGSWAERDGCDAAPTQLSQTGDATCQTWPGCEGGAEVILCTIENGGHNWPGGPAIPGLGHTSTDLDATDYAWEFFQRHPRP